jgi:hypothetical protein
LLEKHNAENLQDFAQTQLEFEFFLDNCHQHVNADGNPYLCFDGVLGSAEKGFDTGYEKISRGSFVGWGLPNRPESAWQAPPYNYDCTRNNPNAYDSHVLLDPFEKDFYLPATLVKFGYRQGIERAECCPWKQ